MKTISHNGLEYRWVECLEDFCGNHKSSGFWADLWQAGELQLITFGGCWEEYAGEGQAEYLGKCFAFGGVFKAEKLLPVFRSSDDPVHHVIKLICDERLWPVIAWV